MPRQDRGRVGQQHRIFDDLGQFAHVARVIAAHEDVHRLGAEPVHLFGVFFDRQLEKMCGQHRDVILALPQRGKVDLRRPEAVHEIEPELPFLAGLVEILVGRRDDPHVDPDGLRLAQARERLLLQHAQQLRLHLLREFPDLVQEERPAVGLLEKSLVIPEGPRECPLDVPEELAFKQGLRDGGDVDGHEGP